MKEEKIKEAFLKIKQEIEDLKENFSAVTSSLKELKTSSQKHQDTNQRVIAASGYFDPIHKGHIEYLEKAKKLGGKLVVIVDSDEQAILKKGYILIPQSDRLAAVKSLKFVDEVMLSIDRDLSVCESLRFLKPDIFAKGGDRTEGEIPETPICKELGIKIIDGLGKKIQSSSAIVSRAKHYKKIKKTKSRS